MELKEAIERLKQTSKQCHESQECWDTEFCSDCYMEIETIFAIDTVLQALEETKKQKDSLMELYHQRVQEVIDLKQDLEDIDLTIPYMQGREDEKAIWRNKIKEKIEEIKSRMNDDCLALHEFQREAQIDVLQELLKGE